LKKVYTMMHGQKNIKLRIKLIYMRLDKVGFSET